MLRWIVASSLKFRLLVIPVALAVIVVGVIRLRSAPVDVLPEFTAPVVEIQTESLGLSGAEVEQLITVPLEQDLLNGVKGVESIRSDSVPGLSSIVMTFERGMDVLDARLLVQERLSQSHAGALANVSKPSQMLQPVSSSNRAMIIGLSSAKLSPIELSVLARWTIRPKLTGLEGVANVAIWGHRDRQLQVLVDPGRLARHDVSLGQVIRTTGNAQLVSPLSFVEASTPGTGGFIDGPNQRLGVRHIVPFGEPANLAAVPLEGAHAKGLRLGDVSKVVEGHPPLIGDDVLRGAGDGQGLLLVVEKLPGANTLAVTREVEETLDELRPGLAGVRIDTRVFRPASYIQSAMNDLGVLLAIAGALVLLALVAFLRQWRGVLIGAVVIPLSLLVAVLVIDLTGGSVNALVVAGLGVALAFIVGDAVGDIDAIARRLRDERAAGISRPVARIVLDASLQNRRPMGYATLIALLVVVPVLVAGGLTGAFVHPLATSYVLAVIASMAIALTVTPALGLVLFTRPPRRQGRSRAAAAVSGAYARALARSIRGRRPALLAFAAVMAVGLLTLPFLDQALRPTFQDRELLVRWNATPSTSLTEMHRITTRATRELQSVPGVQDVGAHIGRAVTGDQAVGTGSGELWATLRDDADYNATVRAVREVVTGYPGVRGRVLTYESDRTKGVLTPADDSLTVRMYGQEYGVLGAQARRVQREIAGVDGVRSPRVQAPSAQPTLQIQVDLAKARRAGVKPGDVRRAAGTLVNGLEVGSYFEKQKVFSVVVWGPHGVNRSISGIGDLQIDRPGGGKVRLGDVASVTIRPNPVSIRHEAVERYVDVRAAVDGRSIGDVRSDVRARLRRMSFPLEYHAQVVTPNEDDRAPAGRFTAAAIAAALGIFLLLQSAFASWRLAALAFLTLPMALVGAALVMLVDGGDVSLGAAVGLIAVIGVAARNAVVLLTRLQGVEPAEGTAFDRELVVRTTLDAARPIVLGTVAAALALLPFAVAGGAAGNEITQPLAATVLGGLVTATVLALFVLPAGYLHLAAGAPRGSAAPGPPSPTTPPPTAQTSIHA